MRSLPLLALFSAMTIASCTSSPGGDGDDASPSPSPTGTVTATPSPTATATPVPMVRFVAVGDTGTGDENARLVAQAIGTWCAAEGCDYILLLGDNVYPSGVTSVDDSDWGPAVEVPYESLGIPLRVVLGNHDYGRNGDDFARADAMVARGAVDPIWQIPMARYLSKGEIVTLIVPDTNALIFNKERNLAEQTEFAAWAIEEAGDVPWKIAAGHHPYLSNGDHGNAGSYKPFPPESGAAGGRIREFYEHSICGKVDLLLTAHDHSRQFFRGNEICPTPIVVSGAGAELGTLPGTNPSEFQSATLGFTYITATSSTLTLEMIAADGHVDFATTLTR